MTTALLLDHVSAYAAAVRSHLADLTPEQVDDLTDGLEADLVEALEDRDGPVVTGIQIGRAAVDAGLSRPPDGAAAVIDLTRRFGPAAAYAAELRVAAGLSAVGPVRTARVPLRTWVAAPVRDLFATWRATLGPFLATSQGQALMGFLGSLRPLWWVLRGWIWYVVSRSFDFNIGIERFIPVGAMAWLWLAALVALSISVGRGLGDGHRIWRKVIVAASVLALLWAPWATTELRRAVDYYRLAAVGTEIQYVETTVTERVIEDGVFVDGIAVSNLFVYDAAGEPLTGVQIFDDRGRAVQTTFDDGWNEWFLPGVDEPWHFLASRDADGRDRWNVYPLVGVPASEWAWDDEESTYVLGVEPRIPPRPFAKAPSVVVPGVAGPDIGRAEVDEPDSSTSATP